MVLLVSKNYKKKMKTRRELLEINIFLTKQVNSKKETSFVFTSDFPT